MIISEQNIYSVKIFNTYFSTKLSFTNTRFHLHVLEKFLYMLQEVRSFIYFRQFVHAPSLMFLNCFFHLIFFRSRTKRYCVSSSCSNFLISMTLFEKKENAKVFDVCPRQHSHDFCYLMIVLVRAALSAKLVLRYKHKFEAI